MSDLKDFSRLNIIPNLQKNIMPINPMHGQIERIQKEQEETIYSLQRAREDRDAEELRRHNELVSALKDAGEKGSTIVIGDNSNDIQIQQNSAGASQQMTNSQTFNYEKTLDILKEIRGYVDFPQFQTTFGENANSIKTMVDDTIKAVENREDESVIKKSLHVLRDLAVGAGGSLIASGIIALLGTL